MINVGILTSCINPNTNIRVVGNIEQRSKDLINNLNFLNKKNIFDYIFIIDSSIDVEFLDQNKLEKYLLLKGLVYKKNNIFIKFISSPNLNKQIRYKGKGLSEMKMLIFAINFIKNKFNDIIFYHKISGRYKFINIDKLVTFNNKIFREKNKNIILNESYLLQRASTNFYSFSSDFEFDIFNKISEKVDDKFYEYLSVERLFYSEVINNLLVESYRSKLLPIVDSNLEGGSGQGKLTINRQLVKNFIYKYF